MIIEISFNLLYYKPVISRFAGEHEDSRSELNNFKFENILFA